MASVWDFSSWLFLTLGFLVFELTSDIFLGIVVTCFKLGGQDVLTAIWARRDPVRVRGGSLACFCIASACYKIAGVAILLCATIVLADVFWKVQVNLDKFVAGMCLIFSGAFVGTIASLAGLTLALRHHRRIWLDKQFRQSRRYREFPPVYTGTRNQIPDILTFTGCHICLFVVGLIVGCVVMILDPRNNKADEAMGVLVFYAVVLIFPVWQLVRGRRILARSPEECWPELNADDVWHDDL